MNKLKAITISLNGIYVLIALLFVSDLLGKVEISNESLKIFVHYALVFLTIPLLIFNYLASRPRFISMSLPTISLILIVMIGPLEILTKTTTWKTQIVHYENRRFSFVKIVYQMQDNGAFGYNQRTVQTVDLLGLLTFVSKIPDPIDTDTKWLPLNKQINGQAIKYP